MKFYKKKKFSAQNDILTLELKYWILENNFSISLHDLYRSIFKCRSYRLPTSLKDCSSVHKQSIL